MHVTLGNLGIEGPVKGNLIVIYRANKEFFREHLSIEEGWTTWIGKAPAGGPDEGIDHVNFFRGITPRAGHPAYRLVVES